MFSALNFVYDKDLEDLHSFGKVGFESHFEIFRGKLRLRVSSLALKLSHCVWGSQFQTPPTCLLHKTNIEAIIRLSQGSK